MAKKAKAVPAITLKPVALQLVTGAAALTVASHVSFALWALTLVLLAWLISRKITATWWVARSRRFGRDLEARSLSDLGRLARLLKVPFDANVPVAGLGDADAIVGRSPVVVEVKSWRRWDLNDGRCVEAIHQVERLLARTDAKRALIWLPQGELNMLQRLGFNPGMPRNIRVVVGPAWRPLWRAAVR